MDNATVDKTITFDDVDMDTTYANHPLDCLNDRACNLALVKGR
jgi:hypothetical protein